MNSDNKKRKEILITPNNTFFPLIVRCVQLTLKLFKQSPPPFMSIRFFEHLELQLCKYFTFKSVFFFLFFFKSYFVSLTVKMLQHFTQETKIQPYNNCINHHEGLVCLILSNN